MEAQMHFYDMQERILLVLIGKKKKKKKHNKILNVFTLVIN